MWKSLFFLRIWPAAAGSSEWLRKEGGYGGLGPGSDPTMPKWSLALPSGAGAIFIRGSLRGFGAAPAAGAEGAAGKGQQVGDGR